MRRAVIFQRLNRAGDGLVIREDEEAVEVAVTIDGRRQAAILDEQDLQALEQALAHRVKSFRSPAPTLLALQGGLHREDLR